MRKKIIIRHVKDGKRVSAGTPGAKRIKTRSKKWYADIDGKPVPLSSNKTVAQQMLGELLRKAELRRAGLATPAADYARVPLAAMLDEFRRHLAAARGASKRPPSADRVVRVMRCVESVLAGCAFTFAADINIAATQTFLADLALGEILEIADRPSFTPSEVAALLSISAATVGKRVRRLRLPRTLAGCRTTYPRETVLALAECRKGMGLVRVGVYAASIKRFTTWLVSRGRLPSDPLADLSSVAPETDHRHDRRPLSAGETERFLSAVPQSKRVFRGLAGPDRWAVYLVTLSTGFRRGEVARLTPARFRLSDDPPSILLAEAETKNDRGAVQPLPLAVADAMREYIAGRQPHKPIWPGTWHTDAAEMLRRDLDEAGISHRIEGPNGPLFVDFHSLRHSFGAMLKRSGVNLSQAMRLMRHSDPRLTIKVYGREDLAELGAAVNGIGLVAGMVAGGIRNLPLAMLRELVYSGIVPAQRGRCEMAAKGAERGDGYPTLRGLLDELKGLDDAGRLRGGASRIKGGGRFRFTEGLKLGRFSWPGVGDYWVNRDQQQVIAVRASNLQSRAATLHG